MLGANIFRPPVAVRISKRCKGPRSFFFPTIVSISCHLFSNMRTFFPPLLQTEAR